MFPDHRKTRKRSFNIYKVSVRKNIRKPKKCESYSKPMFMHECTNRNPTIHTLSVTRMLTIIREQLEMYTSNQTDQTTDDVISDETQTTFDTDFCQRRIDKHHKQKIQFRKVELGLGRTSSLGHPVVYLPPLLNK